MCRGCGYGCGYHCDSGCGRGLGSVYEGYCAFQVLGVMVTDCGSGCGCQGDEGSSGCWLLLRLWLWLAAILAVTVTLAVTMAVAAGLAVALAVAVACICGCCGCGCVRAGNSAAWIVLVTNLTPTKHQRGLHPIQTDGYCHQTPTIGRATTSAPASQDPGY